MTKKDYIRIGDSLAASMRDARDFNFTSSQMSAAEELFMHIVENLCMALSSENPKFNSERFREYIAGKLGLPTIR